jgi:RNA polymerase-binding transcription factor DksA
MTPMASMLAFGPLLARHQRAVLHHLCKEIERSGHPDDVSTAHWVEEAGADIALRVFHNLYSPHLRKGAIDALEHIQRAQRRLEQGLYDLCDHCGTTLTLQWLQQHPAALRCPLCIRRERAVNV